MYKVCLATVVALVAVIGAGGALAAEPATASWGNVYTPPSALEAQVGLNAAELIERRKSGPFASITNIGVVNNDIDYNGPVTTTSSSSTNVGNMSSVSSTVEALDSMVVISNGVDQSAKDMGQQAGSSTSTATVKGD